MDCETVQTKLLEYLEHSLSVDEENALQVHLADCETCRAEHAELAAVIAHVTDNPVPDPGDTHWQAFPDQILAAFKSQHTQAEQYARATHWRDRLLSLWQQYTWSHIAIPAMLVVFAILFGVYWQASIMAPHFNSLALQQELHLNEQHATQIYPHLQQEMPANHFAFSASSTRNFFLSGRLYAETLALLAMQNQAAAQGHFDLLHDSAGTINSAITSQFEYINALFAKNATTQDILSSLGKLQPVLEQAAQQTSEEQKNLFRLGCWLVDIKLALTIKPAVLTTQSATAGYFNEHLSTAPQGVRANLKQIENLLQNNILHTSEKQMLLELIINIQTTLG